MSKVATPGWSASSGFPDTTDVVLLRHGATRLSPQKRFSGTGGDDPELSAQGREQAHRAATSALLREGSFAEIVCSPLRRCIQTAEVITKELGLQVTIEDDLREMDFGQWEGLTYAEVEERYPHDLAEWRRSAHVAPTGSAETFSGVLDRMRGVAERIATRYVGESVLALTHVTPLKALVVQALGAPPSALYRLELSPASFSRIAYTGSEPSVQLFNETSHLS